MTLTKLSEENPKTLASFKSEEHVLCPECQQQPIYDAVRGEFTCTTCGLVIADHMVDLGLSGRRSFNADEKAKRDTKGAPIVTSLMPDLGLSTVIDTTHFNLSQRMRRVFKWNTRMSWSKRNFLIATTEIKRIGALLNLPQHVKELAASVYRKAFNASLLRGRSINAMVAAALYYACRVEKVPRTLQEILNESIIEAREVHRCYQTMVTELKLTVPVIDPLIMIPKFVAALDLSNEVEKTTTQIVRVYLKHNSLSGKDPKGFISAAIYLACQHHKELRSQYQISKIIGVTEVTLRARYKEMTKIVKFLKKPVQDL